MPPQRPRLSSILLSLWALSASVASAATGGAGVSAVLGQPLDFAVVLRLEPDDPVADCVAATVTAGERRLPPGEVRVAVEPVAGSLARVRVRTASAIDEPVIDVALSVGCGTGTVRRYVLLPDPPGRPPPPAQTPEIGPVLALAPLATTPAATSNGAGAAGGIDAAWVGAVPAPDGQPPGASGATVAAAAAVPAPARRSARAEAGRRPPRAGREARAPRPARATATARAAAAPVPRLRMELLQPVAASAEVVAVEQAMAAVAEAASATRASAAAASATAARIESLERSVAQLRSENATRAALELQLRERLAQVDGSRRWLLPLMLLTGALALLSAWLAWRLGGVQKRQELDWRAIAQAQAAAARASPSTPSRQATAPVPFVTSEMHVPASGSAAPTRARSVPAWPPAAAAESWAAPSPQAGVQDAAQGSGSDVQVHPLAEAHHGPQEVGSQAPRDEDPAPPSMQRTEVLSPTRSAEVGAPRDVSIDELIDLEQQAEFFVVLGQEEAAVDLLLEHLRSTGGGSPLPYLKLLEIHHRRADHDAYERMRARFNHRFNAYAPQWGDDLHAGRSLEDYPGVVPRLQQVWGRPLDAMAELEALLFRKSRGELFDLPAYREVLLLYALARDLLDREAVDPGSVDLLLPLADGGEFSSTSPAPFLGLDGRPAPAAATVSEHPPTAPVDLDLSLAEPANSIFDRSGQNPRPRA